MNYYHNKKIMFKKIDLFVRPYNFSIIGSRGSKTYCDWGAFISILIIVAIVAYLAYLLTLINYKTSP